jgi:ribonuclease P protein component
MLEKQFRITKKKEFETILEKGKKNIDQLIITKTIKNNLGFNRFGIIVSTRISKKATDRNRVKRKIRNVLVKLKENLIGEKDVVIIALPTIIKMDYRAIEQSVKRQLKNNQLLNN